MGTSCSTQPNLHDAPPDKEFYDKKVTLKIATKDFQGKTCGHSTCVTSLTRPSTNIAESVTLDRSRITVTACVLPGMDPKHEFDKE
jgi:hypothetical protein